MSNSALTFQKGAKVSLMGTNVARANILNDIEKTDVHAVRFNANIPQEAHSSTVDAYLQKNVPQGANIQKVG